jgi:hypothetical protein
MEYDGEVVFPKLPEVDRKARRKFKWLYPFPLVNKGGRLYNSRAGRGFLRARLVGSQGAV